MQTTIADKLLALLATDYARPNRLDDECPALGSRVLLTWDSARVVTDGGLVTARRDDVSVVIGAGGVSVQGIELPRGLTYRQIADHILFCLRGCYRPAV